MTNKYTKGVDSSVVRDVARGQRGFMWPGMALGTGDVSAEQ